MCFLKVLVGEWDDFCCKLLYVFYARVMVSLVMVDLLLLFISM